MLMPRSLFANDEDKKVMDSAQKMRDSLAQTWLETSRYIDSWLSDGQSTSDNKSRVNISIEQFIAKSGDWETDVNIRGKLDIPNTKRQLKLLIDSDVNDQSSLVDKKLDTQQDTFTTVGIGRTRETKNFQFDTQVGAKFSYPIDPFARVKAEITVNLSDNWINGFKQKAWYFHEEGWGESSEYFLLTELNEHYQLRISTEAQYQKQHEELEIGQFFTLYEHIPGSNWHSFTIGVTGSNQPNPRLNTYFLAANYRLPLFKDWIFLTLDPRVRFLREDSWNPNPELELRIDILFEKGN
jgi:hypothetical protein|tara:strand:+ start:6853 stop:7740 length:888 start_codon:yes stop_codon:yes gene_type:complete